MCERCPEPVTIDTENGPKEMLPPTYNEPHPRLPEGIDRATYFAQLPGNVFDFFEAFTLAISSCPDASDRWLAGERSISVDAGGVTVEGDAPKTTVDGSAYPGQYL